MSEIQNEHTMKMYSQRQRNRPGGHIGKPKALKAIKGDWKCWNHGKGNGYDVGQGERPMYNEQHIK